MPSIPHVERRGAVYYWRRRLPAPLSKSLNGSHLVLSLGTKEPAVARQLAAILDGEAMAMASAAQPTGEADHRLSAGQLKGMFAQAAKEHLVRLQRVAQADRLAPDFSVEDSRQTDHNMAHVYRLLAAGGAKAAVTAVVKADLLKAGLNEQRIAIVGGMLDVMRLSLGTQAHRAKLEALLAGIGGVASPINLGLAKTTKFRAIAATLFDTRDRWDGIFADDTALLEALTRQQATVLPSMAAVPDALTSASMTVTPTCAAASVPCPPSAAADAAEPQVGDDIVSHAEGLVGGRLKNVEEKTKRQILAATRFFAKYVDEVHGVTGLRGLRQEHLAGFVHLLQTEMYVHHGKSEHDERRTIAELRAAWTTRSDDLIGIDKPTTDRWTQQLAQVLAAARSAGVKFDRELTFKGLVVSKSRPKRARDARPTMRPAECEALFRQPPFTGCADWNAVCTPGLQVFHCALYFATLLLHYGGERREEICGALVTDVIVMLGGIPHILLRDNKHRRLKNAQSERRVAIHPELIRLGFLDYIAAIKALGYELLFPDLYSPTTRSPLGDRYHDQLRPVLDRAGITAKGTGSHSARRGFGNNLKQKGVDAEKRAELLGHGGDSETTERYCDDYELQVLYDAILKLPVVTEHLQPVPLRLVPWVAAKCTAPFSQPGRMKEAKARRRSGSQT